MEKKIKGKEPKETSNWICESKCSEAKKRIAEPERTNAKVCQTARVEDGENVL